QGAVHLPGDLGALRGGVHRTHLGALDVAAPDLEPPGLGGDGLDDLVGDRFEHVHALDRQAGLAAVVKPAHAGRAGGGGEIGVVAAGLATTVLPVTSAGASLLHSRVVGKFHGTIAPTTPRGRLRTKPSTPGSRFGVWAPRRAFESPA